MSDLRRQVEALRARLAGINEKYSTGGGFGAEGGANDVLRPFAGRADSSSGSPLEAWETRASRKATQKAFEEWLNGQEVKTAFGSHFETETAYASHRLHGSADIGALSELPHDLLDSISEGAVPHAPPESWAFLDTETTGLSGGSGTCAFLVGVGSITEDGFRVRQFFMRDLGEEASSLDALARYLEPFRVVVTYNGRAFDQPLLETRCLLNNAPEPFARLAHLDLLHGARRLWKLRYDSCRLVDLEQQVLGYEREGDVPGALIPYLYFEYLRTRQAVRLLPVFHHNALDILTLACLTAIVPYAFQAPGGRAAAQADPAGGAASMGFPELVRHGAEMIGMARWLRRAGDLEQARELFRRALGEHSIELRPDLRSQTLWDLAAVERKLDCDAGARELWEELGTSPNPFQLRALEELAKFYEHRERDVALALEWTRRGLEESDSLPATYQTVPIQQRFLRRLERLTARMEREAAKQAKSGGARKRPQRPREAAKRAKGSGPAS